jgi:ribulose-phosphate 3-epimerase
MIDEPQRFAKAFAGAGATVLTVHLEAPGVAGAGWPAPVRSHGEGAADADPDATRQETAGTPPAHGRSIDLAQLRRSLAGLRTVGARVGLALRPDSKFEDIEPVAAELDLLLVMTVYPGFSGQEFLSGPLETVRAAAAWRRSHGARFHIEVDGGIQADGTGPRAAEAGADVLVAGHGIYRQPDPLAAMRALKSLAPVA